MVCYDNVPGWWEIFKFPLAPGGFSACDNPSQSNDSENENVLKLVKRSKTKGSKLVETIETDNVRKRNDQDETVLL